MQQQQTVSFLVHVWLYVLALTYCSMTVSFSVTYVKHILAGIN